VEKEIREAITIIQTFITDDDIRTYYEPFEEKLVELDCDNFIQALDESQTFSQQSTERRDCQQQTSTSSLRHKNRRVETVPLNEEARRQVLGKISEKGISKYDYEYEAEENIWMSFWLVHRTEKYLCTLDELCEACPSGAREFREKAESRRRGSRYFTGDASAGQVVEISGFSLCDVESIAARVQVSEVQLAPARCLEKGNARVAVPHRSKASNCVFCATFCLVPEEFPVAITAIVKKTVKERTVGANYYDIRAVNAIFSHVGVRVSNKLSTELRTLLGVHLPPEKRLAGLLTLQKGLFVVADHVHCLGIDCGRKLIFNCGKDWADELSIAGFRDNKFGILQSIYSVNIHQPRLQKVQDIASDKAQIKILHDQMMSLFCKP